MVKSRNPPTKMIVGLAELCTLKDKYTLAMMMKEMGRFMSNSKPKIPNNDYTLEYKEEDGNGFSIICSRRQ